ncbi:hypothetical protein [Flavobacterium sp. T12S277]|uniref:HORMA-1 domain-containing protein n=1 Tax=Flavobacterium sp. T12S277 TaxID=3402752 RepID=UPI003AE73F33
MSTYTFTGTETYSESDVKAVMQNTYEDIIGFANRQIITYGSAESWIEELTYVLNKKVVKFFEVQLRDSSGDNFKSYRYNVDSYGYLSTGANSGGINYFAYPTNTTATLFVQLTDNAPAGTFEQLQRDRGWGNGTATKGNEIHDRNYVSNNLRIQRSEITK